MSVQRHMSLLPIVLGFSDGILTVLTFAANRLMDVNTQISMDLTMRISLGVLIPNIFIYFIASYAELRSQLIHAEKQLNLTVRGKFATTKLGKQVIIDAVWACTLGSIAAFLGAFIPLSIANIFPQYRLIPIIIALFMLVLLGFGLARAVYGNLLRWSLVLFFSGLALCYIGLKLHIV